MKSSLKFATLLRLLMAMVMWNECCILWSDRFFTVSGFSSSLNHLASHNFLPVMRDILHAVVQYPFLMLTICFVLMVVCALALMLGVLCLPVTALSAGIFSIFYLSHAGVPGNWVFEYVMPAGFFFLLMWYYASASRRQFAKGRWFEDDFSTIPLVLFYLVTVLFCGFVYWANVTSLSVAQHLHATAWVCVVGYLVVVSINYFFSRRQVTKSTAVDDADLSYRLVGLVSIFIGLMLVTQVHMNYLFQWFTTAGYTKLITVYQTYSLAPHWVMTLVGFVKQHINIALPVQASVETFLPVCLVALIFRPLASTVAFALFIALAVVEFGVPATFPVKQPVEHTWTWELLLTALAMGLVCVYEWRQLFLAKDKKWFLLGRPMFVNMSIIKRVFFCVLTAFVLFLIVFVAHNLAKVILIFSLTSAIAVFCHCSLLQFVDVVRGYVFKDKSV